jgi:hypothetical protein
MSVAIGLPSQIGHFWLCLPDPDGGNPKRAPAEGNRFRRESIVEHRRNPLLGCRTHDSSGRPSPMGRRACARTISGSRIGPDGSRGASATPLACFAVLGLALQRAVSAT